MDDINKDQPININQSISTNQYQPINQSQKNKDKRVPGE
jgi:hypothetical protein